MHKVIVENHEGKRLIVQKAVIPDGYRYVEDFQETASPDSESEQNVGEVNDESESTPSVGNESKETPANGQA